MVKLGAMVAGYSMILLLLFSVFLYLLGTVKPEPLTSSNKSAENDTKSPPAARARDNELSTEENISKELTDIIRRLNNQSLNLKENTNNTDKPAKEIFSSVVDASRCEAILNKSRSVSKIPVANAEDSLAPQNRSKRMSESAGLLMVDKSKAGDSNEHSNVVINEIPIQRVYPPIPPSLRRQMSKENISDYFISNPVKGHRRSVLPDDMNGKNESTNKFVIIDITDELAETNIQIKIGRKNIYDDPSKKYNISVRTADDGPKTFRVDNTVIKIKYNDAWTTFMQEGDNIDGDVRPATFNSSTCNIFDSSFLILLLLFYTQKIKSKG